MDEIQALEQIFRRFANFGSRRNQSDDNELELDATRLVKLAKDCKVIDKRLNRNDVDIIFSKVKRKGHRKINFDEFLTCTEYFAKRKGLAHSMLIHSMISKNKGPKLNGTVPDAVSFHDDKSKYTGTHKNGGPESVAKGRSNFAGGNLASLLDRSPANVRGVPLSKVREQEMQDHQYELENLNTKEGKDCDSDVESRISKKIRVEGKDYVIHPDWVKRKNRKSIGVHDRFFYINQVTNERTWSIPTVPIQPPLDGDV